MNIVTLDEDNLEQEHICCAISNNKDIQVSTKKAWLSERFSDGLIFKKADARGKCFIEYLPAEKAWVPIDAPNYLHINCFWVSGKFKGQGLSSQLLGECIADAKQQGKSGLTILSSPSKKQPFLMDPGFLKHKGFLEADFTEPHFTLYYLPLVENPDVPQFKPKLSTRKASPSSGFVLYHTSQCPFTAKYAPAIAEIASERGVPFELVHIKTKEEAQAAPTPFTSYALFYKGEFITQEIQSPKKFENLLKCLVTPNPLSPHPPTVTPRSGV